MLNYNNVADTERMPNKVLWMIEVEFIINIIKKLILIKCLIIFNFSCINKDIILTVRNFSVSFKMFKRNEANITSVQAYSLLN